MKASILKKGINLWRRLKRKMWLKQLQRRNNNHEFSLITNDCVGGVIYHDLGEQFRSPTVNLWIPNDQFLQFVQNLRYYLSCEIKEKPDSTKQYPVGVIIPKDDRHIPIEVNFMHYSSFEEGILKWKERSARVNYNNLYFIWHFYDDPHLERIKAFDQMMVRKLAILHSPIEGVMNCSIVSCYDKDPYNGKILEIVERTGRRFLDEVDYLSFLSKEE